MKYIAVNHTTKDKPSTFWLTLVYLSGVLLVVAVVGMAFVIFNIFNKDVLLALTTVALLSSLVLGFPSIGFYSSRQEKLEDRDNLEAQNLRVKAIEDTYGLKLTWREFYALNYPFHQPEGEVRLFGSYVRAHLNADEELVRVETTLAWVDSELRLFKSVEGEKIGAELPRVEKTQESLLKAA